MKTEEIAEGIYLIGGPNVTRPEDAAVYLVDFGDELVMIDSGAGTVRLNLTVILKCWV